MRSYITPGPRNPRTRDPRTSSLVPSNREFRISEWLYPYDVAVFYLASVDTCMMLCYSIGLFRIKTADSTQPRKCSIVTRPFSSWEGRVWAWDLKTRDLRPRAVHLASHSLPEWQVSDYDRNITTSNLCRCFCSYGCAIQFTLLCTQQTLLHVVL